MRDTTPTTQPDAGFRRSFRRKLLIWFRQHKRVLPWRLEPRDPYNVWLAEVMLQQTQVATVIPYYERWLQRFPNLRSLAQANQDDVLKQWEGLGYYARARNLHGASQIIINKFNGRMPNDTETLLTIPGIGRYTAGAIASLAFGKHAAILDANVARVLIRVFNITSHSKTPDTIRLLWSLSQRLLPRTHCGGFNEALMDLGALVCTPQKPDCPRCPLSIICIAYAKGTQHHLPVKTNATSKPHKHLVSAVLVNDLRMLVAQRPRRGLLGGLWEFPGGEVQTTAVPSPKVLARALTRLLKQQLGIDTPVKSRDFIGEVHHSFSHFSITRHVAFVTLEQPWNATATTEAYINVMWADADKMKQLAFTRSDLRILRLANKATSRTRIST